MSFTEVQRMSGWVNASSRGSGMVNKDHEDHVEFKSVTEGS